MKMVALFVLVITLLTISSCRTRTEQDNGVETLYIDLFDKFDTTLVKEMSIYSAGGDTYTIEDSDDVESTLGFLQSIEYEEHIGPIWSGTRYAIKIRDVYDQYFDIQVKKESISINRSYFRASDIDENILEEVIENQLDY